MKGRNEETFLPVFSRPRSNMCFNTFASLRVWEQELYGLNHQSSLEGGNVILLWSNRWRWPQSLPTTGPRCFQKWYQRQRWWRSVQKGKRKKRTKVCWCVKADKVVSSVATFFYLMAGLSKCISSLSGCPVREKMHKDSPVDTVGSHSISVPLSLLPYLD